MKYLSCYRSEDDDPIGNLKWKSMDPMKQVQSMEDYMPVRDYEKLMGLLKEVIVYAGWVICQTCKLYHVLTL